ncbi:MAG: hypothetical protein OEV55_00760 [candidate division Zixibacteria bacterium]|nr:hypothetical protein [candidate division Zixibacteria bacterium]
MSIEVILGGLIGSILTVIITKVLDIVQKGREHRYSLQKSFFEKKLQAAEAAVSQWYIIASSVGSFAKLYERMSNKEKELDYQVFRVMNESFSSQLQKLLEKSNEISNSVLLYFDIEDSDFWNYEPFGKYLDSLSSIVSLDMSMRIMVDIYDKVKGTKYESMAKNEIEKIKEQSKERFKDLSLILDKANKEIINLLRKLRSEMKKYET